MTGTMGTGELETRTASLQPLRPADTHRDDPALIAFTSGTTGVPKGCVQFHRDLLAPCDTFAKHLVDPKPGDVFLTSAPMAFTFGLGITPLFPLRFGAASATVEQATPDAAARRNCEARRHAPRHRADRLQGNAVAAEPRRCTEDPSLLHLGRRAAARSDLASVEGSHRNLDHRRHRRDRDDAHLRLCCRRRHPARFNRKGRAGLRSPVLDPDGNPLRKASAASRSRARPAAATSMTRASETMSSTAGTSPAIPTARTLTAIIGMSPEATT